MRTYEVSVKYKTFHESSVPSFALASFDAAIGGCVNGTSDAMPVMSVWDDKVLSYELRPSLDGMCAVITGTTTRHLSLEDAIKEVFSSEG